MKYYIIGNSIGSQNFTCTPLLCVSNLLIAAMWAADGPTAELSAVALLKGRYSYVTYAAIDFIMANYIVPAVTCI